MAVELLENVSVVENITSTLETMRLGSTLSAPNFQRVSFNGTCQRLKDTSSRRYSFKRVNDTYFTIKRIR